MILEVEIEARGIATNGYRTVVPRALVNII